MPCSIWEVLKLYTSPCRFTCSVIPDDVVVSSLVKFKSFQHLWKRMDVDNISINEIYRENFATPPELCCVRDGHDFRLKDAAVVSRSIWKSLIRTMKKYRIQPCRGNRSCWYISPGIHWKFRGFEASIP